MISQSDIRLRLHIPKTDICMYKIIWSLNKDLSPFCFYYMSKQIAHSTLSVCLISLVQLSSQA